jgi:hypothetical protein
MASTINGTSTGNGGLISTGDDSGILNIQTNETTAITVDASQMVGIGTTTPKVRLAGKVLSINGTDSAANYQASIELLVNGASAGEMWANSNDFVIGSYSTQPMVFRTQNTERMRIDSSGNLLVGQTTLSNTTVGGAITSGGIVYSSVAGSNNCYTLYSTAASAFRFYVTTGGQINATSTSITAISDLSLKENIRDLETGLTQVMALKPRRFDWKEETKIDQKNVAGFIAQELEQVLPELVYEYQYNATETKKSIKMGDILPTLVKAIQELKAINDTQAETINALTARIVALESRGTV